jgi:hypothetical protein
MQGNESLRGWTRLSGSIILQLAPPLSGNDGQQNSGGADDSSEFGLCHINIEVCETRKFFLGFGKGRCHVLVLANAEAAAAFLGTSCATCKLIKKWLNMIILEESEGKHRSVYYHAMLFQQLIKFPIKLVP